MAFGPQYSQSDLPSMHHYSDFGTATHEGDGHRYQAFSHSPTHFHSEPSWAIDPIFRSFQDEHNYALKANWDAHKGNMSYFPSPADSTYFPPSQPPEYLRQQGHFEWSASVEHSRPIRYNSPSGSFGGNLSDSSTSEYTLSPDHARNPMVVCNSPREQSFHFAPLPLEAQMNQPNMWSANHTFISPLSTPSTETDSRTQAIAMKEIEGQMTTDFHLDDSQHEDPTSMITIQLPLHTPEELELSDFGTGTSSGHDTVFSSQNTEHDTSENEPSMKDLDSDSDFNPHRRNTDRYMAGMNTHRRTSSNLRSLRRSSSSNAYSILDVNSRVHKPARSARTPSTNKEKSRFKTSGASKKAGTSADEKPPKSFPCTFHAFGCTAKFANKNEWKRHVSSQHLRLGYFRCDLGLCNPINNPRLISSPSADRTSRRHGGDTMATYPEEEEEEEEEDQEVTYNDFNRKDLFTQHCRRMHGPLRHAEDDTTFTNQLINERVRKQQQSGVSKSKAKISVTKDDEAAFEKELETIRARCWAVRHKAPARSCCGICNRLFQADLKCGMDDGVDDDGKAEERAWEERMEHIGRHYERDGSSPHDEAIDEDLQDWGLRVGILKNIVDAQGMPRVWLVGYDLPTSSSSGSGLEARDDERVLQHDSQRRRGLRRRGTHSTGPPALPGRHDLIVVKKSPAPSFDSEIDADAEDE